MGDISKHFSWYEFSRSEYAIHHGIDNSIPAQYKPNIQALVNTVLEPFRENSGWIVNITSGYRCQAVNEGVGGVPNSQHKFGKAADIMCYKLSGNQRVLVETAEVKKKFDDLGLSSLVKIIQYASRRFCHVQLIATPVTDSNEKDIPLDSGISIPASAITRTIAYTFTGQGFRFGDNQSKVIDDEYVSIYDMLIYLSKEGGDHAVLTDNMTGAEFEKLTDGDRSNFDRIVERLSPFQKMKYKDQIEAEKDPYCPIIRFNTTILIPVQKFSAVLDGLNQAELFLKDVPNFKAFWNDAQKSLLQDPLYVPFDEDSKKVRTTSVKNSLLRKAVNVRVWIYMRALDKVYDVSPVVMACSTDKSFDVGNFSLEVAPIVDASMLNKALDTGSILNQFSILDKEGNIVQDFFTKYVQQNDVVFIRFEQLKKEQPSGLNVYVDKGGGEVSKDRFGEGLIWDMIGLVDKNVQNVVGENTDYSVNITGRDLMKVFVEDGSYFIPLKYVDGSQDRWFYGGDQDSTWYKRNVVTGDFNYLMNSTFMTIKSMAWAVIDVLSNLGIVPDDLFTACAKRTKRYMDEKGESEGDVRGIWKIIQMWVDPTLEEEGREIVDRSLIKSEGTLMELMKKVCQDPFVEFWGDTWNDGFEVMARKPPFSKSAIEDIIDSKTYIEIRDVDFLSSQLFYDDRAYAWFRIMPQNALVGKNNFMSLAYVPIIYLDKYVEHFGNKRLVTNDVYIPEEWTDDSVAEEGTRLTTVQKALLRDLLFTIEINAYLPFTRRGTIVLNGDRRIKVGTFVKLGPTNELFYVTSVNQTAVFSGDGVDRTTSITVERGMKIEYIKGKPQTYFNIVNIEGLRSAIENSSSQQITALNNEVFDFFLKRKIYGD